MTRLATFIIATILALFAWPFIHAAVEEAQRNLKGT
jgi:hypothetical protein